MNSRVRRQRRRRAEKQELRTFAWAMAFDSIRLDCPTARNIRIPLSSVRLRRGRALVRAEAWLEGTIHEVSVSVTARFSGGGVLCGTYLSR